MDSGKTDELEYDSDYDCGYEDKYEYDNSDGGCSLGDDDSCDPWATPTVRTGSFLLGGGYPQNDKDNEDLQYTISDTICPLCATRVDGGEGLVFPACKHSVCVDCFRMFVDTQVEQGRGLDQIMCPAAPFSECGQRIPKPVLEQILGKEVLERLDRVAKNNMVANNPCYHHCPTPDCENIVFWAPGIGPPISDCFVCRRTACIKCGVFPFHKGQTCDEYQRFFAGAVASERMTDSFLDTISAKRCKRCDAVIIKESGCNKMKCRCGYRFCFVCGSENAQCGCTPSHHGFTDNVTGRADFIGLHQATSAT